MSGEGLVDYSGINELVNRLEGYIAPPGRSPDWFGWQSLSLYGFYRGVQAAREKLGDGPLRFLDVGSGIGTKLYLASTLGFKSEGIEMNGFYAAISRDLFPEFPVQQGNILDITDLEGFDLIYSYRLSRSDRIQQQINEHIIAHMRDEAVFFSVDTRESQDRLVALDGAEVLGAK